MSIYLPSLRHALLLCSALACPTLSIACSDKTAAEPPLPRNIEQAMEEGGNRSSQPLMPAPAEPDPATVPLDMALAQVSGKALLPGDQVIAALLALEAQGSQKPVYKSTVDYPFSDGAAQAISEEVRKWIRQKMAAMGFSETQGKPTLSWIVHVEPDIDGQYRLETSLQSQGSVKFKKNFMVPAQYSSTRMNHVFSEDFMPQSP